jgi:hypothetical protein
VVENGVGTQPQVVKEAAVQASPEQPSSDTAGKQSVLPAAVVQSTTERDMKDAINQAMNLFKTKFARAEKYGELKEFYAIFNKNVIRHFKGDGLPVPRERVLRSMVDQWGWEAGVSRFRECLLDTDFWPMNERIKKLVDADIRTAMTSNRAVEHFSLSKRDMAFSAPKD